MKLFEPGAIVRLKSGGPNMLVLKTTGSGLVVCMWVGDNGLECDLFLPGTLLGWLYPSRGLENAPYVVHST